MECTALNESRIAVKVEMVDGRSKKYKATGEICIMKKGALVSERPKAKIVDSEGNEVQPNGKFLWSAETMDPFHLVTDMF